MPQGLMLYYVHSDLISDTQKLETTQMSHNWRMDKNMLLIYTIKYYSAIKNKVIMNIAGK